MHIQMVNKLRMSWEKYYADVFKDHRFTVTNYPKPETNPDVIMFMWADEIAMQYINNEPKKSKYVVFLRSYELLNPYWRKIDWSKVDKFIMVNDYMAETVKKEMGLEPEVIYNGVDMSKWRYRERKHGKNIAMVCHVHYKKNHAMALQILSKLPEDYRLHCAGDIQSPDIVDYLDNLSRKLKRKIYIYGHVDNIDLWLEDKNYILSTSFREGCPNNILEAMAKGIKPIIHNWPGAKDQFGRYVFDTVDEAVNMILSGYSNYDVADESRSESDLIKSIVEKEFSLKNLEKVKEEVCALQSMVEV